MSHPLGGTWLEVTIETLKPYVENIVVAGQGELPESLKNIERIKDAEGLVGPLAGIIGAMKTHPHASWVLTACDMPLISRDAIEWLLAQRSKECVAVVPRRSGEKSYVEPLFACYEKESQTCFNNLVQSGTLKIREICNYDGVCVKEIPEHIARSWTNVNAPVDLKKII